MSPVYNVQDHAQRADGVVAATTAVGEGKLIVLPTDTVYGVGADPFNPDGVAALLAAKGRGREKPPAVLVPNAETVEGLAMNVPSYARRLMERFWPGGLTLIFRAQPSLMWDLGDTNGTVGLRMPNDEIALDLLRSTGPLAVSSANRTGQATACSVTEAGFAFGPAVEVYLDGGERGNEFPSTIIDCTKADPVILRRGAIGPDELREVLGPIDLVDSTGAPVSERARPEPEGGSDAPAVGPMVGTSPATTSEPTYSTAETQAMPAALGRAWDQGVGLSDVEEAGRRYRQMTQSERSTLDTQALPHSGIGAEPPFDREQSPSAELPGRPPRPTD